MADVSISYKGNEIASMNATGVKTLLTSSAFCEDDITVTYTKPAAPVPSLQTKSATYTPSTSQQTASITADAGYDGLNAVNVTVNAMPSGSATTPATTITANPSISVSSGGLITASVSASKSVTPTVSAGYVSSGTAGTVSVSGSNTSQLTTQAAQTIHPSTSDQTIASGKYLTGAQTVKGVLLTNLSADNIKKDVVVKVGDSTDDDCVTSVTGTYEGGGASNVCQGTFTTVSSQNTAATFDTGYTGSGYPVALVIYVDGGPFDSNSEWYNTLARYAVDYYSLVKSETTTVPSYSNSGTENQGSVMMMYKSSSSSPDARAIMYTNTNKSFSSSNANSGTVCVRFKNNNHTVSYYTYGISTGLPVSTKMVYIALYSS